eukprot:CAMPEP_0206462976 /NCGR_PEP_ID=MMETSP0324_2-20121206/26308_1 /ASSEMBLY_ACC=CAM_ASM_000836 /TAXON_ID=2866 /ORGANISM="Crypthecodinium cohnii, Strain Seligo" /LENGTH=54 /DNA_ID=CAMNT_0053935253 /DNA_START=474 /DNA_END=638 /DNA_ORIENTATION=-
MHQCPIASSYRIGDRRSTCHNAPPGNHLRIIILGAMAVLKMYGFGRQLGRFFAV